jgi:hypothetical protein
MKSHLLSALMCLVLLVGAAFAATPATELLYVQQGQNIVTYSVNTKTAVTKKPSTLRTAYSGPTKITIKKISGSFLYLLRFSPTIEYFTVNSLTTAGKPKTVRNHNAPRDVAGGEHEKQSILGRRKQGFGGHDSNADHGFNAGSLRLGG